MWLAANLLHILFDIHSAPSVELQPTSCRAQPGHVFAAMFPRHLWDVVTLWVDSDGIPYFPFVHRM